MRFSDLIFKDTLYPRGIQAIVQFGNYSLSIIRNEYSYGSEVGLYEIGAYHEHDMINLPGITSDHDTVKGYLTEEQVSGILMKMHTMTATQGIQ